ncbi:MAG TPA: hypothetical protein VG322_15485 [Candidatus Acidoferrales bacterium]|jgi:hypothetical protein|nr:hypothetical protein [Candidatus Acidoferrales bacterium]
MRKTRAEISTDFTPNPDLTLERAEISLEVSAWKAEEPWMAILVEELGNSFRMFAKESGRLSRLVQAKKKCSIPSEGFNLQLSMRMECVESAFHIYMRRKDELLSYILATAHHAQRRAGAQLPVSPAKPNSGLHIEPKIPDKKCVSSTAPISTEEA